jgi:hypothetical protein
MLEKAHPLDLPYLRMNGRAIMERNFEPSFRRTLAAKDAPDYRSRCSGTGSKAFSRAW